MHTLLDTITALLSRGHRDQAGEGVISTGIAVLIMAIIGAGMWLAFNDSWTSVKGEVDERTDCIVDNNNTC